MWRRPLRIDNIRFIATNSASKPFICHQRWYCSYQRRTSVAVSASYSTKRTIRLSPRSMASLSNPMFPQKQQTDLADVMEKHSKDSAAGRKGEDKSGGVADVLADHGGKIAAISVLFIVLLIYSYYESGQDRTRTEEAVANSMFIEPHEMLELRYMNQLQPSEYALLVKRVKEHFKSDVPILYEALVDFIQTDEMLKGVKLRSMHLLDRFMMQHQPVTTVTSHKEEPLQKQLASTDRHHDVNMLLVLLNLCMLGGNPSDATERYSYQRIEQLFQLGLILEKERSRISRTEATDSSSFVESYEQEVAPKISRETLKKMIDYLIETDQVPAERQVIETGVKWPVKLHRRKTSTDMITAYEAHPKVQQEMLWVDADRFRRIITSTQVCAWGECYRRID